MRAAPLYSGDQSGIYDMDKPVVGRHNANKLFSKHTLEDGIHIRQLAVVIERMCQLLG